MVVKKYGSTKEEVDVQDMIKCREIVQEILNFGVNQRQLLKIAYLLSLELESRDDMVKVSGCIQEIMDRDDDSSSSIIV